MAWERLANLDTDPGRQILLTPTLFPARALRRHLRFSSPGLSSLRPCCSLRSRVLKLACASKPCKCEPDSSTRTIGSFSGLPEGQARSSLSAQSLARNLDISPLSARCPLALVDAIGKSSRLQHALAVSFTRLVLSMWSSPALAALCLAVVRRRSVRDLARSRSVSSPRPTANKRRTRDMLAGDGDGPQPAWPTAIFFLLKFSYPTHNKLVISCHLQKQLAVLSFFFSFFSRPQTFFWFGSRYRGMHFMDGKGSTRHLLATVPWMLSVKFPQSHNYTLIDDDDDRMPAKEEPDGDEEPLGYTQNSAHRMGDRPSFPAARKGCLRQASALGVWTIGCGGED